MINNYLEKSNKFIDEYLNKDDEVYKISYIISRENLDGLTEVIAITHDGSFSMSNVMITLTGNTISCEHPNFSCFSEEYLFDKLEENYKIEYISMAFHVGIWDTKNSYVEKDYTSIGLQKYLKYCNSVGISNTILAFASESELSNLMDYYHEENQRYKIIAKTSIGKEGIVLGYNKNAPSEFVTWRTEKMGYDSGHYFSDFKSAWEDYQNRCIDITTDHVINQKSKSRSQIDSGKDYER